MKFGSGTVGTGYLLELSILYGQDKYPSTVRKNIWLQAGDEVVLDIELLGSITGRITPGSTPIPLG